jgi:hypothetical protein
MVVFFFALLHDEWFDYTQYKRAYDARDTIVGQLRFDGEVFFVVPQRMSKTGAAENSKRIGKIVLRMAAENRGCGYLRLQGGARESGACVGAEHHREHFEATWTR